MELVQRVHNHIDRLHESHGLQSDKAINVEEHVGGDVGESEDEDDIVCFVCLSGEALDFYFSVGCSVFRKQLSSQRHVPISAGLCAHATKSWKITRFGQNQLGKSQTTFRARAIIFSRGDIAPLTYTYHESPFQGLF